MDSRSESFLNLCEESVLWCSGAEYAVSVRRSILVAQAWRHAFRTRSRVVLQLIAQVFRIGGIVLTLKIRIKQQRVPRQRLGRKSRCRRKNKNPFKTSRVKKKNAKPSRLHPRKPPRSQN